MADLYRIAQEVTDEVLGKKTYAQVNKGNADPNVQQAIRKSQLEAADKTGRQDDRGADDEDGGGSDS